MTFRKWLMQFKDEHSPVGDLARDVKSDREFVRGTKGSKRSIRAYLVSQHACWACLDTFDVVWKCYKDETKS